MNWFEMMNVDLPNLTSIEYEVGFFTNVHVATLKSSSNFWILIVFRYSKSTKWLSWRLIYRHTRLFYWEYFAWNAFSVDINTKIVSHIPKIYHLDFIQSINSTIESVFLPDNTCNDAEYTIFDFSRFTQVESIEIGNDCFGSVKTFKIDGLNQLKTLAIGNNSFTQKEDSYGNDESKSFHILNCESLESIQIGEYSFSDFGGEFELKNLPQLSFIVINRLVLESRSKNYTMMKYQHMKSPFITQVYNFCFCSFMIEGNDMILV